MKRWIKSSKKGMAVLVAVAFMLVAGWQFGVSGTEAVFSETEVALEKAIAGSGGYGGVCCQENNIDCPHPIGLLFADSIWKRDQTTCD